jgi:hypothetical protein
VETETKEQLRSFLRLAMSDGIPSESKLLAIRQIETLVGRPILRTKDLHDIAEQLKGGEMVSLDDARKAVLGTSKPRRGKNIPNTTNHKGAK